MALSDEQRGSLQMMETKGRLSVDRPHVVLAEMAKGDPSAAEMERIDALLTKFGLRRVSWG